MTVDAAVDIISRIIGNTLEEYDQSPQSKDEDGNRKPHPLDIVDPDDKLFALDMALKEVALKTTPATLIEGPGSTAPELRRVNKDYYVRVPAAPQSGQNLDIDDGLAYAVVFRALSMLWSDYGRYEQQADSIIGTYDHAYRDYIKALTSGQLASQDAAYIRFSADGQEWHDGYQPGDLYISFKRIDTDSWTPAIRFVGRDGEDGQDGTPCSDTQFTALHDTPASYSGMGGKIVAVKDSEDGVEFVDPPSGSGGASTFLDLSDTPASYTAGKYVAVNSEGDALEFVDPPSGGSQSVSQFGDNVFYDDSATGTISLDADTYNSFYLYPNDDLTISFAKFDDDGQQVSAHFGSVYTFAIVNGNSFNIAFDSNETIYGDASIAGDANGYPLTLLRMYYDGVAWIVVDRVVVSDYAP
ncbi:hypothetical protein [Nitratifractor sp.]